MRTWISSFVFSRSMRTRRALPSMSRFDVLGDDDERASCFHHRLGDEIRDDIAAVELHAFDDIEFGE